MQGSFKKLAEGRVTDFFVVKIDLSPINSPNSAIQFMFFLEITKSILYQVNMPVVGRVTSSRPPLK
jgi:hypothetical protein